MTPGVTWGRVVARATRVLLAASGPSARELPLDLVPALRREGAVVLAVNGAGTWLPAFDAWVTVDLSQANRYLLARPRCPGAEYLAAVEPEFGTAAARHPCQREPAPADVTYLVRRVAPGLSDDPGVLHSGNSAWGALQVARLAGARRVVLLGVDASPRGERYAFEPRWVRPRQFEHLPDLFRSALPQLAASGCEVVVAGEESRVDCFPRLPVAAALRWLTA